LRGRRKGARKKKGCQGPIFDAGFEMVSVGNGGYLYNQGDCTHKSLTGKEIKN